MLASLLSVYFLTVYNSITPGTAADLARGKAAFLKVSMLALNLVNVNAMPCTPIVDAVAVNNAINYKNAINYNNLH